MKTFKHKPDGLLFKIKIDTDSDIIFNIAKSKVIEHIESQRVPNLFEYHDRVSLKPDNLIILANIKIEGAGYED